MPRIDVVLFTDNKGSVPLLDWLDKMPTKVQDKATVRIERLAECGHELRRPEADLLRDGIYELRVRHRHSQYRILYFFHGKGAVLSHGLKKEGSVPRGEIDRAKDHSKQFKLDPDKHTYRG